ncbi:hypothetical protein C7H79_17305 [Nitrosomonas supralitoralis]|uniref:Uncharacterized protein n=1 Tax=Nitrosomonas supralitoralis TaxID=2116706 RepID=A0A2P7NQM7_9PROT|nr:hypothetical protein C7H79_17305 [Nitrosomonas supralitoralis]
MCMTDDKTRTDQTILKDIKTFVLSQISSKLLISEESISIAIFRRRKMSNSGYNNKIYTRRVAL